MLILQSCTFFTLQSLCNNALYCEFCLLCTFCFKQCLDCNMAGFTVLIESE